MKTTRKSSNLTEREIDVRAIEEANDDSAWEEPIMHFAGAWSEMKEQMFLDLMSSIAPRRQDAFARRRTEMSNHQQPNDLPITIDPEIMSGVHVVRGTRVPVQTLFDYLADGYTLEQFLHSFPTVARADALAILEHATEHLSVGAIR